jgi:hypothetical protein
MAECESSECHSAVWAALRRKGSATVDELQMLTGCEPLDIIRYLNVLLGANYSHLCGMKRAASGECVLSISLAFDTGPMAPYNDATGRFVDPNLKPQPKQRPKREFPTLPAIMRLEAERHPGPFTQAQMIQWCGTEPWRVRKGWDGLRWRRELESTEQTNGQGQMLYTMRPNEKANQVREFLRTNAGRDVRGSEIKELIPGLSHGSVIARALDLLAAEGFTVSIDAKHDKMPLNIYRVEDKRQPPRLEDTKKIRIHRRGAEHGERSA